MEAELAVPEDTRCTDDVVVSFLTCEVVRFLGSMLTNVGGATRPAAVGALCRGASDAEEGSPTESLSLT